MTDKELILKRFLKIDDKLLVSKILDRAFKTQRAKVVTYSDFLDPYQKGLVEKAFSGDDDIDIVFDGGYDGAERNIVIFRPSFMSFYEEDEDFERPFRLIHITTTAGGSLTHRDYLGSLMGLGIKREKIGDILVREDGCSVVVLGDIADYIQYNLTKVGNVKVRVEQLDIDEIQTNDPEVKIINTTVASLRLDCLAAAGFGMSRNKILDYITAEKVSLNWDVTSNASKAVKEGDTISVRGRGRVTVEEIGRTTRKGRIGVILKKLI